MNIFLIVGLLFVVVGVLVMVAAFMRDWQHLQDRPSTPREYDYDDDEEDTSMMGMDEDGCLDTMMFIIGACISVVGLLIILINWLFCSLM